MKGDEANMICLSEDRESKNKSFWSISGKCNLAFVKKVYHIVELIASFIKDSKEEELLRQSPYNTILCEDVRGLFDRMSDKQRLVKTNTNI